MPNSGMGSSHSWATELVEYYKQGYADSEVACAMNISMRQFNTMLADNPTFAKLVEFGRTLSLAWWEGQARKNLGNKQFNTPLWVFTMKNKYGWADKIDTNNSNEHITHDLEALRSEVFKEVSKLMKNNTADIVAAKEVIKPIKVQDES